MTITPGTPDDWTDTVEPKRAEAFTERLPDGVGYNLRHYGNVAHQIGEECYCRPSRIPHVALAAPESAHPATLTPEQPVKAPVEGEDSASPSEPVLPRRIKPEDVRVGMVVERRKGDAAVRDRAQQIDPELITGTGWPWLWMPGHADVGWSLWLIEDAPAPVDPDAEAVERMAKEVHDRNCADGGCRDWDGHGESTRKAWREDARVVIRNLRAQGFDVTPRAEQ